MNPKTQKHILWTAGLLAVYALAFGLDSLTEIMRRQAAMEASNTYLSLWFWSVANLILALAVFAYYAWVMPKLDRWIIWGIVILGLLIDFAPVLYFSSLGAFSLLFGPLLTIRGNAILAGGLTAAAGIFTLLRMKKNP